jgi:hypothetical protein
MPLDIAPALGIPVYAQASELWVVTAYYNPCRYLARRRNYDIFAERMRRSGVSILTVECAFGDEAFELPPALDVIRLRSRSLLWQKERLLNLAAALLPPDCTAVAWIDCDVLFRNGNWVLDTLRLLRDHAVVQLFETCLRLGPGNAATAEPDRVTSFGAIAPQHPELISCGRYDSHGHTGYAWAMRRELFDEIGLYEHAVTGSADHYMAHAVFGRYGFCFEQSLKGNRLALGHLLDWCHRFYRKVRGGFAVVPGEIVHLWHGDIRNRRYLQRVMDIARLGYNPYTDLVAPPGRPLEWRPKMNKPELVEFFAGHFASRREDG